MSYEKYLKMGLEIVHPDLSVRVYKLANREEYPLFQRGKDLRIQVYWKNESKYEFIIEQSFWYLSNTNKEDRAYMRVWADLKLKMFKDALVKKSKPKANKKKVKKLNPEIGSTQTKFEEMKKVNLK